MKNSGASFGINFVGLNLLSLILLFVLGYLWYKDRRQGWLLMILGGILNLGERLFFGGVTDYWRIPWSNVYNNINDYLIFVGGVMVVWSKWKRQK